MALKVALDNQVSKMTRAKLERIGFEIVVFAGHDHDEYWFQKALDLGVDVFVSPDIDIVNMASRENRHVIQIPNGIGGEKLHIFILNSLKKYRKSKEQKIEQTI